MAGEKVGELEAVKRDMEDQMKDLEGIRVLSHVREKEGGREGVRSSNFLLSCFLHRG